MNYIQVHLYVPYVKRVSAAKDGILLFIHTNYRPVTECLFTGKGFHYKGPTLLYSAPGLASHV